MGHKCLSWGRQKRLIRVKQALRSWTSKIDSNSFFKQCRFQRTLKEKYLKSETSVRTIFRKRLSKTCQNLSLPTLFFNFFYFSFTLLALANHVLHNFFQSRGGKNISNAAEESTLSFKMVPKLHKIIFFTAIT